MGLRNSSVLVILMLYQFRLSREKTLGIQFSRNKMIRNGSLLSGLLLVMGSVFALPDCPENGALHNCSASVELNSGSRYVGDFVNGLYEGQGEYTYSDGEGYAGAFLDGKFHGQGIYSYANGDKYVGEFKLGKKSGRGVYTRADGSIERGVFLDGRLIYESERK
ncbi:MAG: hypothetical protein ACJ0Q9_05490 [Gammaproteobacteria bacterium]|tara:strand:+ start:635 stop:1126 length:492 start_codon:yes stop_codon:yes gene_type:complete